MPGTFGLIWVAEYKGTLGLFDVPNCAPNAQGLSKGLSGTEKFNVGNDDAQDIYIEQHGIGVASAGKDAQWADTVDLVFFSGHGAPGGMAVRVAGKDDSYAKASEIRLGDGQLKWLVVDGCEVLQHGSAGGGMPDNALARWRVIFTGLRQLLGFATECHDVADRGSLFAQHLGAKLTMREAWIKACMETEGHHANVRYAYLRAKSDAVDTANDKWDTATLHSDKPSPASGFVLGTGIC